MARAFERPKGVRSTRGVAGATRRLPANLRFSLESADRGEADEAGEARGTVPGLATGVLALFTADPLAAGHE